MIRGGKTAIRQFLEPKLAYGWNAYRVWSKRNNRDPYSVDTFLEYTAKT